MRDDVLKRVRNNSNQDNEDNDFIDLEASRVREKIRTSTNIKPENDENAYTGSLPREGVNWRIVDPARNQRLASTEKRSENHSLQVVKQKVSEKVVEKKEEINVSADDVLSVMDNNIDKLNAEKETYVWLWRNDVVESIEKKLAVYNETKTLVWLWKIEQNELNKLKVLFSRDIIAKWDADKKNYDLFAKKMSSFNSSRNKWVVLNSEQTEIKELTKVKTKVDDTMQNIQREMNIKISDLDTLIHQLRTRGNPEDLEKANDLSKHLLNYQDFVSRIENDDLSQDQKKWLIYFLQNDEARYQYLTDRSKHAWYKYDTAVEMWKWVSLDTYTEWTLRDIGKNMVNEEMYILLWTFSNLRSSIPWLWTISVNDNIEEFIKDSNINLNDEEKENLKQLLIVQETLKNFDTKKKQVLWNFVWDIFQQEKYALEFQLSENEKLKEAELRKIDLLDISDEEKTEQKEVILKWYSKENEKLTNRLSNINKYTEELNEIWDQEFISEDKLAEFDSNMPLLSLTSDVSEFGWILNALAKEDIEWRWILVDFDLDIKKLKDYSTLWMHENAIRALKKSISDDNKEHFFSRAKETKNLFIWDKVETDSERNERYKRIDDYLANSAWNAWTKIILFIFQLFEILVNGVEKTPVYIAKAKQWLYEVRWQMFIISFLLVSWMALFWYKETAGAALIELNNKLYSLAEYTKSWNWMLSFDNPTIEWLFPRISLIMFLMSLIVMYQIIIEIMARYIEFIKNSDDKSNTDKFLLSIWKTWLFFMFVWLVFKVFV